MEKVLILMSTYNGEKYLREQLDSIINQRNVKIEILVRDDGSTDSTIDILKEYEKKGNLKWYKGENLKPAKSFMDLLNKAYVADYYAFCDQDDYWQEEKMIKAIERLQEKENKNGKLYFSALNVVDEDLNELYKELVIPNLDFKTEMIKNYATGCTMVFDKTLKDIVNKNVYNYIEMHDSLICKIAYLNDSYIYIDDNSYILYRQHGDNVLGMSNNPLKIWKKRWKRFVNSSCEASNMAKEFLSSDNFNYDKDKKYFLELLANYKNNKQYKKELSKMKFVDRNPKTFNVLYRIKLKFKKI